MFLYFVIHSCQRVLTQWYTSAGVVMGTYTKCRETLLFTCYDTHTDVSTSFARMYTDFCVLLLVYGALVWWTNGTITRPLYVLKHDRHSKKICYYN